MFEAETSATKGPEWPHRCSIQKRVQPTRGPTKRDQHGVPNDLSDEKRYQHDLLDIKMH